MGTRKWPLSPSPVSGRTKGLFGTQPENGKIIIIIISAILVVIVLSLLLLVRKIYYYDFKKKPLRLELNEWWRLGRPSLPYHDAHWQM